MKLIDCTAFIRRRSEICILGDQDPMHQTMIVVRFQALMTNRGDDVGETNPGNAQRRLREVRKALFARDLQDWADGKRVLKHPPGGPEYYQVVYWYRRWAQVERIDLDDMMPKLDLSKVI